MAAKKPSPGKKKMGNMLRLTLFWVILVVGTLGVIAITTPQEKLKEVSLSNVIERANKGEIKKLEIEGDGIKVTPKNKEKPTEKTIKESNSSIYEQGLKTTANVEVAIKKPSETGNAIWSIASILLPVILIGALFLFMMRQAQGQNNQAMGFGKSKAKLYGLDKEKVVFADIAGNEAAKQDLEEVVDFLKHPKKYQQLGAKIPKGVLLVGNPGTGKTMLARAVAGEANVPFFSISGSEFVEMFVGVGASRVRDLFAKAKKIGRAHV